MTLVKLLELNPSTTLGICKGSLFMLQVHFLGHLYGLKFVLNQIVIEFYDKGFIYVIII
jgi:hypothetical protein